VDIFNPKVVQSSMGSVLRTKLFYTQLADFLRDNKLPVFGAFLEGENLYHQTLHPQGVLVLGSEGKGISPAVSTYITNKLHIPKKGGGESLNVSMATAIFLSAFHRNT
jgi:TrmH family RNA methyltransferase